MTLFSRSSLCDQTPCTAATAASRSSIPTCVLFGPARRLVDTFLFLTGSAKDIDVAVAAAREAFNTTWGKNVSGVERARLINKLADLMERDAQELAELECLNNGKPVRVARFVAIR